MKKIEHKMKKETDVTKKNPLLDKKYLRIILIGVFITSISFLLDRFAIQFVNFIAVPALEYIFVTITSLGEIYIYFLICVILTISLMIYRKPFLAFILGTATAALIQWLMKIIIHRTRPFDLGLTTAAVKSVSLSFPSGHTMMFFVLIPIIGKKFPHTKLILWIVAVLVGLSRIYLGVHFLSDVVAGAFLGYLIGMIFMSLEEKYRWTI